MASVTFSNNLGSVSLDNALYSISHKYNWTKQTGVIPVFSVTATGTIHKDEFYADGVAPYTAGQGAPEGRSGSLDLAHKTYSDMSIRGLTYHDGTWNPYGKVTMVFDDDRSSNNISRYMIHWWTYAIYDPKITINPSKLRRADASVFGLSGWYRQLQGYGMMTMNISGFIEAKVVPDGFVETLEKKYTGIASGDEYRSGYPLVYNLEDAVPEATGDNNINFHNVMVTGGSAKWYYEKGYADVSINLIIPPQKIDSTP